MNASQAALRRSSGCGLLTQAQRPSAVGGKVASSTPRPREEAVALQSSWIWPWSLPMATMMWCPTAIGCTSALQVGAARRKPWKPCTAPMSFWPGNPHQSGFDRLELQRD